MRQDSVRHLSTLILAALSIIVGCAATALASGHGGSQQLRRYVVVLTPAGLRQLPDFALGGGKKVYSWEDRVLAELTPQAAHQLADDARVMYVRPVVSAGEEYAHDETIGASQSSSQRLAPQDLGFNWRSGNYEYDGAGNIKLIGTASAKNSYGKQNYYLYDALGRLKDATAHTPSADNVEAYVYDGFGNLTSRTTTITAGTTKSYTNSSPASPVTNQLDGATYDLAGNMTAYLTDTYAYDAVNMMTAVTTVSGTRYHIYTADDERLGTKDVTSGKTTWTVRGFDAKVLRVYEQSSDNPATAVFVWLEDYVYRDGQLVASEREDAEGGRRFFHNDHLGTPRLVTNASGAKLTEHTYYPFGTEATATLQDAAVGLPQQRMRFTGHERDFLGSETTENENYIDYMHARYYLAAACRFVGRDPVVDQTSSIKNPQAWNAYLYVRDNPLNATDPTGMVMAVVYGSPMDVNPGDVIVLRNKKGKAVHIAIVGGFTSAKPGSLPHAKVWENVPQKDAKAEKGVGGAMTFLDRTKHKAQLVDSNSPDAGGLGGWNAQNGFKPDPLANYKTAPGLFGLWGGERFTEQEVEDVVNGIPEVFYSTTGHMGQRPFQSSNNPRPAVMRCDCNCMASEILRQLGGTQGPRDNITDW